MLKRFVAIVVMCALTMGVIFYTRDYKRGLIEEKQKQEIEKEKEQEEERVKTFDVWYEYNGYEEYLKYVAEEFTKETGVTVNLKCINEIGFATFISEKSIKGEGPDVFISSNTMLENMYLSGNVTILGENDVVNEQNYAKKAVESVTFNGKVCGYPLGYDVSMLAYNANHIKVEPKSFEDIKAYVGSDEAEGTTFEGISKIFELESNDLLYNYGFFAKYFSVDKSLETGKLTVSLNSEEAKSAATQYVALKEYFGLSNETRPYSSIVADFAAGKTLFAILNTQIVGNAALSTLNYNVMSIPNFSDEIKTTAMSYAEMIVVNPYSDSMDDAVKFAKMASYDFADKMYEKCKILSSRRGIEYTNPIASKFFVAFEMSTLLPNYMETEDYALLAKNAINHIWNGQDITAVLDEFQSTYEKKNEK